LLLLLLLLWRLLVVLLLLLLLPLLTWPPWPLREGLPAGLRPRGCCLAGELLGEPAGELVRLPRGDTFKEPLGDADTTAAPLTSSSPPCRSAPLVGPADPPAALPAVLPAALPAVLLLLLLPWCRMLATSTAHTRSLLCFWSLHVLHAAGPSAVWPLDPPEASRRPAAAVVLSVEQSRHRHVPTAATAATSLAAAASGAAGLFGRSP
jgi:hypothetical protein